MGGVDKKKIRSFKEKDNRLLTQRERAGIYSSENGQHVYATRMRKMRTNRIDTKPF